ncbi:MAG: hypothetical protein KTR20_14045 [Cellvibrionaceae bacterium]|nr:hypothetical protein [Cellvibrionaceae bacterium]
MQYSFSKYRDLAAQGWVMMFLLVLSMFVINLVKSSIFQDFSGWQFDPGEGGLLILVVVMVVYAFMPMFIKTFQARFFRIIAIIVAVFFTLFFIAHQLNHMIVDGRPIDFLQTLDFAHHIMGSWVAVLTFLWLREGKSVDND